MRERIRSFADRAIVFCFYLMMMLVPFSIAALEICAVTAIVFFILKKIACPEFREFGNAANLFLLVFFFSMGLSLLNAGENLHNGVKVLVFKWSEYALLFLICADTLDATRIRRGVFLFLVSASVVCLDALAQKFLGIEFVRHRALIVKKKLGYAAVTGPFRHYNDLGGYLVFVFFLAMPDFFRRKAGPAKSALSLLLPVIVFCLLLTFSRGAWASFIVVLVLLFVFKRRYRELLAVCLIIVFAILVYHPLQERVLFTFSSNGDATRFVIWKAAWKMIAENPWLGKGLGTFMEYLPEYSGTAKIEYAHNSFLQMWAESGVFSLLSFLSFVAIVFYRGVSGAKRTDDPALLGLCLGICAYLIHAFFDTHLYTVQLSMLFWIALGMVAAASKRQPGSLRD